MEELLKKVEQLLNKEDVLLLMAYGSRINGNATETSDLDIFIVTNNQKYIAAKKINDIKVEMFCYPIDEVINGIRFSYSSGNAHFKAILNTGKIIINKYNIHEELLTLFNDQIIEKRMINQNVLNKLEKCIDSFLFEKEQFKDNYYFYSLELIRRLFHIKENASTIASTKVYDLYQNPLFAQETFFLKLPSKEFRNNYLNNLNETSREKQKNILTSYLDTLEKCKTRPFPENTFLSNQEIKQKLITMHNKVEKCKKYILDNHPYAIAFYNILVYEILELSHKLEIELKILFEIAIKAQTPSQKIFILEELFKALNQNYAINYEDYYLPLRKIL